MTSDKKNISKVLHDIIPPDEFKSKSYDGSFESSVEPENNKEQGEYLDISVATSQIHEIKLKPKDFSHNLSQLTKRDKTTSNSLINRRSKRKKLRNFIFVALILSVSLYGLSLYNLKANLAFTLGSIQDELSIAIEAIRSLKTNEVEISLKNTKESLDTLNEELSKRGLLKISTLVGAIFPIANSLTLSLDNLKLTLNSTLELNDNIAELKEFGLSYFVNGYGDKITEILRSIQSNLKKAIESGEALQNINATVTGSFINNYFNIPDVTSDFALFKDGYDAQSFIDSLIATLSNGNAINLLVLFQNASEIRPSGGFIGSYASLTIKDSALNSFDVRDIYDPDGWVQTKIIPPEPLQAITTDWEARDANWFLDFRLSAKKVISRLEDSLFYKDKNISFVGAIAINTNVMEDLLNLTGPIPLPQYELTITKENFLDQVQYEVEAGRNKAKNQPKKILSDMTPMLLEKLSELNKEEKDKLFELLQDRISSKDIQIYFKEKSLEHFIEKHEIGGALFEIPENWSGDYLAVVNANIAGGKTDSYINQNIRVKSSLDISGKAINSVSVVRTHSGGKTAYPWYNVTNKNYLRILTPPDTTLTEIKGETNRVIKPPINYVAKGYVSDHDISLLESDNMENDKNVFGAWRFTEPKSTSTIVFSYERTGAIRLKSGNVYHLIFDKQSGVKGGIEYSIEAPPGFRWLESKNSIFNYVNDNPPTRIIIDLTLEEI